MEDRDKTKTQLLEEVAELRQRVSELKASKRRNSELALFNRIIAASASDLGPNVVLETACNELARAFKSPQVAATMFNKEEVTAVVVAEYLGPGQPSALNYTISLKTNAIVQHLFANKSPLIIKDTSDDSCLESVRDWGLNRNIAAMLIVPLIIEGEVVGCLEVDMLTPYCFSPEEESLVQGVVDQVAGAVSRAWMNEERQLLSTVIRQAADIIMVLDNQGTVLYVNPAFEEITGYTKNEITGKPWFTVSHGVDEFDFYNVLWSTIKAGRVWRGHITNLKKSGATYIVDTTIAPVKDEANKIINYVSTQRNVTRELELEKQYRQAQKMEAIGQLTAGIAHDFNNLLMAINGFAELMQFRLPNDSPFYEMAGRIVSSGESAANLIRQLLIFSRKQAAEAEVLNVNDTVTEIDKMLRRIIGEDINLQTSLAPELWAIKIDPSQIEQIIVNLGVNARDAMPTGGQLAIVTTNVELPDRDPLDPLGLSAGQYVILSISDTGIGMSEDVKEHIFEPFFTTKEQGKGTGLGLATVYGIIKQNGGNIKVHSKEGHGTTFEILMPRVIKMADDESKKERVKAMSIGTETILLVEDSPAVKELVTLSLSAQGYDVISADNGAEALGLFRNYKGEIDLLLTDVVMPQMGGKELADQITTLKPDIKVIFTSGYGDDAISQYGVLDPNITFLQKPFSPAALVSKVREVLDTLA